MDGFDYTNVLYLLKWRREGGLVHVYLDYFREDPVPGPNTLGVLRLDGSATRYEPLHDLMGRKVGQA